MSKPEKKQDVCDEPIFYGVFTQWAEPLRNFLYYQISNLAEAEDLVQDAFSKLWENCQKVTPEKAKSYLFTVGKNLMLNRIARNKTALKFINTNAITQTVNETPQDILEQNEFQERLESAINELPEGQKMVFLMNRLDGQTYKEIAKILDISIKAVEKRMHKALSSLRKIHDKV